MNKLVYGYCKALLLTAGAPEHLVQIVTGDAEAGNALVTSGVNKLIFVGSTDIGKKVMQAAAQNLTPVVLELGGKDAFIVCDDANLSEVCPTVLYMPFVFSLLRSCALLRRYSQAGKDAFNVCDHANLSEVCSMLLCMPLDL